MQAHAGVYLAVPWPLAEDTEHVRHRDFEQHLQAALDHNPHSLHDPLGTTTTALLVPVKAELQAIKDGVRSMFELPSEVRNPGRNFDLWCKPQPYSVQLSADQNGTETCPTAVPLSFITACHHQA